MTLQSVSGTGTALTVQPEVPRNHWGQPRIGWPGSNKLEAYARGSTVAKTIEDTFKLGQWMQRHVAIGLSLAGVDAQYRLLAVGILVIVAVSVDQWIRRVRS